MFLIILKFNLIAFIILNLTIVTYNSSLLFKLHQKP